LPKKAKAFVHKNIRRKYMLLSRGQNVLDIEKMEWYMRIGLYDNGMDYFHSYYYNNGVWSDPIVTYSKTGKLVIGEELKKVMDFLESKEGSIEKWLKEDTPLFLEYYNLSDDFKLINFQQKSKRTDLAIFEGTKLKIGINFFDGEFDPRFSFEGENFSNYKHDWILLKYPNLVKQIKEKHPKRLNFLF
jgi:hypothetical protein